uniref:Reverse transcriptase domain-containing protein n=1 Tax=Tanacetum cinerariifolium TaxID=118510 RepID=A0A699HF18_TANCI|nr:hypothetical protein [Tanacetum cinerariifolium]
MCGTKVCGEQKQNMEDTMLVLLEVCRQKEIYCMYNNVDDLIESDLDSKLLSINLKSQRLDKQKHEVKNIVEQPTKRRTRDEHLSIIPKMESDEVIKSSVKNLVPIPNTLIVYSPKIDSLLEEFFGELAHIDPIPPGIDFDPNDDIRFIEQLLYDDTSSEDDYFEDIDYVEASPSDSELVSLEEGELTNVVIETILGEPRVHMLNILPTQPNLDSDLTPLHDSLGSENNIFDPRIFTEVQSERLLSREEFSISFIRDPLYPVFDTLLLFSSENEDKVFKPDFLSCILVSHREKITSDFSENPMMMYGGDMP